MDLINTAKASERLKIKLEPSTMVLIDVVTYEVAVGASIFMVEVADEDRHQ
jgi:hypothetical protein